MHVFCKQKRQMTGVNCSRGHCAFLQRQLNAKTSVSCHTSTNTSLFLFFFILSSFLADSQFPIDISSVKRDHDFLERDLVEPLCRYGHLYNCSYTCRPHFLLLCIFLYIETCPFSLVLTARHYMSDLNP